MQLVKLNKAKQALMEAKTLEEIKEIRDVAKAAKAYAIAKKMGVEMKNEASEIEIRAIREMGKLLQEGQDRGEIATQKDGAIFRDLVSGGNKMPATLSEIGISRKESSTAKTLLKIPDDVFEDKISEFKENQKSLTKTALLREIAAEDVDLDIVVPSGKYRIIYADPPWKYSDVKAYRPDGAAENHYPVMTIDQICNMELPEIEDNAVLFLWTTSPLLEDSFKVIKAWGFQYKTSFIWDKIKHNMGHYNSVRHELLLICTRGSCLPDNIKLYDSVQSIERTDTHSEKPEIFREIIDTLYTRGKRIELFARKHIDGWDNYGNQL